MGSTAEVIELGVQGQGASTSNNNIASAPAIVLRVAVDGRTDVPPKYVCPMQDEPPSYASIFGKAKKIQRESMGHVRCADRLRSSLAARVACRTIAFLLFLGVPLAILVVGAININHCPAARMIPVYMVVAGSTVGAYFIVVSIRKVVTHLKQKSIEKSESGEQRVEAIRPTPHPLWRLFDGVVNLFIIGWFIAGNYIVYTAWKESPPCVSMTSTICDLENETFCDMTLLLTAFWVITGTYITCGCCTCSGICIGCIIACIKPS